MALVYTQVSTHAFRKVNTKSIPATGAVTVALILKASLAAYTRVLFQKIKVSGIRVILRVLKFIKVKCPVFI